MLEALLAWLINNYIGEYFDNVNTDQLSIAYGEGEIELDHLPLKVEPFRRFNLPFQVQSGKTVVVILSLFRHFLIFLFKLFSNQYFLKTTYQHRICW